MKKRIFSRALALLMALSLLSSTAFAATLQDLQDAIDGNTKTGTLIEGSEHENHYGYGDLDEASGNWGIEAWDQDGGRNVQLNEDAVYNDGKDTVLVEIIDDKNVVIDLNGNNIKGDSKYEEVIYVGYGGELTVKGTEPAERTESEEPAPSGDSGEADAPADTANTIIGDIFNDDDGTLTVDKATVKGDISNYGSLTVKNHAKVDGNVSNSGTFYLEDSTVTKTVDNSVGATFNNHNSMVGYGDGGKYTLETLADGKQKLTIYPDETGTIAGETYWFPSSWFDCQGLDASQITEIEIKDGVTSIVDNAFYNCESLKSVTIPDSVTSIEGSAFSGCSSLTSVTIPGSVTSIGQSIFYDCTSLTDVYYEGTQEQWEALSIYASVPDPAAVHYNSAAPAQPEQHEHHRRQRG